MATTSGCLPAGNRSTQPADGVEGGLLSTMGFALTDDGDPGTPAGTLEATFQAPVIGVDEDLDTLGTAHVAFDDVARDIASAGIVDAYPGTDIVYVVLFQTDAPWRYVIVAAHAADLTEGNTIAFDGTTAAAITVDEVTASGYLATNGSLTITSAAVASGGSISGSLVAELSEVALETWPEGLFPLSTDGDGESGEILHATASGSFEATFTLQMIEEMPAASGVADVTVAVDDHDTFHGVRSVAAPIDVGMTAIVIEDESAMNVLVLLVEDGFLVADGTAAFDGYSTGAWLLSSDGSQLALTTGSLHFDSADLVEGGSISGSISSDGEAWFLPPGGFSGDDGWDEPPPPSCGDLEESALSFVPTWVEIDELGEMEGFEGFDRALAFVDEGGSSGIGILLPPAIALEPGISYSYDLTPDMSIGPVAFFGTATCEESAVIEGGMLTSTLDETSGRLSGSISYVVNTETREITFDLPVTFGSTPP
jgi:hypothetical protein